MSGYQPSPRPSYDGAAVIARPRAARHVWGDAEAGQVLDRIYVSNHRIHQLLFEIPAGGQFTHSDDYRTVFGADEVLYVLDGDLVMANPQTGQVVRVAPGEAVFFRPGTWHHAFNWGAGPVRVLEYFAPPPATGTSGAYARQRPLPGESRYGDDSLLGRIIPGEPGDPGRPRDPGQPGEPGGPGRLTVVRPRDYLWRLDGDRAPVLAGLIASTPHLTVARCEVRGSGWSGWLSHPGDTGGYVLAGTLLLQFGGRAWHELGPGDGFYVPGGERYQVCNAAGRNARYLTGSAPTAGPDPAAGGGRLCSPA